MTVLDRMLELDFASAKSVARAKKEKLKVKLFQPQTSQPYFVEYIKQQLLHDPAYDKVLGKEDTERRKRMVFQGGLKIYTTLEPKRQAQAKAAVRNQLWTRFGRNGNPTGALASVDPKTGRILALYGGRENFKRSQVDLATARGRQRLPARLLVQGVLPGRRPGEGHLARARSTTPRQGSPSPTAAATPATTRPGARQRRRRRGRRVQHVPGHRPLGEHLLRPAGHGRRHRAGHRGRPQDGDQRPATWLEGLRRPLERLLVGPRSRARVGARHGQRLRGAGQQRRPLRRLSRSPGSTGRPRSCSSAGPTATGPSSPRSPARSRPCSVGS